MDFDFRESEQWFQNPIPPACSRQAFVQRWDKKPKDKIILICKRISNLIDFRRGFSL